MTRNFVPSRMKWLIRLRHTAASRATSVEAHSVITVSDDLEIIAFSTVEKLWSWLEHHHATHPGAWV